MQNRYCPEYINIFQMFVNIFTFTKIPPFIYNTY